MTEEYQVQGMEIQGQDDDCGSETFVLRERGSKEELGRGGFGSSAPNDRFVSRRHVSLQLQPEEEDGTSPSLVVRFEVIGRNPIWVFDHSTEEIQIFRKSEKGKLEAGDKFCLSSNRPVWLGLKRIKLDEKTKNAVRSDNDLSERLEGGFGQKSVDDLELESVDISEIDPVKEFGFLVLGHEFDKFPQKMVCGGDNWNWFLEEPKGKSEEDEGSSFYQKRKKGVGGRSSRKKRAEDDDDDDDDEWKGEGDEEEDQAIMKSRRVGGAKYSTRSMDGGNSSKNNKHHEVRTIHVNEDEEEDNDDETLGGFIVTDEEVEEEEIEEEEEEIEEEEFH